MWWHSAAKQVLVARDSISPCCFWNRATSTLKELANTTSPLPMFLLKTQSKHRSSTHKLNNNTVTPTAHLVGGIKLTVLPTPALCNSSWRKYRQLETTKHNIFMFFTTPLTLPVQQTMILKRLLHQIGFCRVAADDANMFLCPKVDRTQHVTETAQRRSPTP